jgi:hypothetical protein
VGLNEIWRFDLVRGFTRDPSHGACLLTAVSWLADGKLTDRPKCVCPLLAQFGRHANDILYQYDRQRLKAFIYRLAGSQDASAIERRARIIVSGIVYGILERGRALDPDRFVTYLVRACAIFWLRLGFYRGAVDVALTGFRRRYRGQPRARREYLVDVLCKTFDEALSAGQEGELDPVRAAAAMDGYERKRVSFHRSFEPSARAS